MSQHPPAGPVEPLTSDALRREAKDWVLHIATGEATESELASLQRWRAQSPRHDQAYADACRLWTALGTPLEASKRSEPGQLSVARAAAGPRMTRRAIWLGGAATAAAAAVTGVALTRPPLELWPSLNELGADYRTAAGEQRRISLTERVTVEMNTRTSLSVDRNAAVPDTIELVSGEAAVATNARPVVVRASDGEISATDAQFTVRCEAGEVRVTCLSGLAQVTCGGKSVSVRPRQQVTYTAQDLRQVVPIDPDIVAAWRDGVLVFDNERLAHVIDEVNRYRPGRIVLINHELGERRISARFKIARLDAVLTQFQEAFGAKVTSIGGLVLMS